MPLLRIRIMSDDMVEEMSVAGHNAYFSISIPKRRVRWNTLCIEWFYVHGKTKSDKKTKTFFHITLPNECCKLHVFLTFSWLLYWIHFFSSILELHIYWMFSFAAIKYKHTFTEYKLTKPCSYFFSYYNSVWVMMHYLWKNTWKQYI
jgi:hypothetical protein